MVSKIITQHIRYAFRKNLRLMSSTADTDAILTKEINGKGLLIINRPKVLNAVNYDMVQNMWTILSNWSKSKSMIIIKGNGRAFCAGGDVRALVLYESLKRRRELFKIEYMTNHLIATLKIPYIALIDGVTMGGGVGLSVYGRYRIATEKTIFAMPEAGIGLFPDIGSSYFLPRLQGNLGLYLGLTGFRLKATDVLSAGIATHYCESGQIPDLEKALLDLKNVGEVDNVINSFCPKLNSEFSLAENIDQVNRCFEAKTIEEILNNLEKDNSDWAKQTMKRLLTVSPLSLKVTLRQLKLGANKTLEECLQMEYRLAYRFLEDSDFDEGVRALLIDKDNKPRWNPPRIEEVTENRVLSFFDPLPDNDRVTM